MACTGTHTFAHLLLDAGSAAAGVEKGDMLLPRYADHQIYAMAGGQVEEPAWGDSVEAHGVDTAARH